jgi:putative endonuclease
MVSSGKRAERRAAWWYRLRGYRVLAANAWAGGYELDLVVRRGRRVVFCEVKEKTGPLFGQAVEMVDEEKQRRIRRAAEGWLAANPDHAGLAVSFDVIAVQEGRLVRLSEAF